MSSVTKEKQKIIGIMFMSFLLVSILKEVLAPYLPSTLVYLPFVVQFLILVVSLYFLGKALPKHDRIALWSFPAILLTYFLIYFFYNK